MIWESDNHPPKIRPGFGGWCRLILRALALIFVLLIGVMVTALLRLIERPFFGARRPWTPFITQWVSRLGFVILGIKHHVTGTPMTQPGAVVANHSSWLDIFALNAAKRVYFVSKAEVAKWPGIGFLAKITGTLFIERDPKQARAQNALFQQRLLAGHKLAFFPEGTSTDGQRVIAFKTTLFQSFMEPVLKERLHIQPVTLVYHAPQGADPRTYGWWGDMDFGGHLLQTLAATRQGAVHLTFHEPVAVSDFANRKDLAAELERTVRAGMPADRQISA